MTYTLLATKRFRKQLENLDGATKRRVKDALQGLMDDPHKSRPNVDIKQIQHTNPKKFRLRVGDYRIFFAVDGSEIKLLNVADRKNAYKR